MAKKDKNQLEKTDEGRGLSLYELESELTEAMENWLEADTAQGETGGPQEQPAEVLHGIVTAYLSAAIEKRDRVAQFIFHLKSQAEFAKSEVVRLQLRQKRFENAVDRMKEYVRLVMESQEVVKLEGAHHTFSLRKNPDSVEVLDDKLVPDCYMVDRDPVPDKRAIMDGYKILDGAREKKQAADPKAVIPEPSIPGTVRHRDKKRVEIR